MARKPSRIDLEAQNRELESTNTQLAQVLSDVAREIKPDAFAFYVLADGDTVTLKLYRVRGALAGIVLEIARMGNQSSIAVCTLDNLIASREGLIAMGGDYTARACAIDKLQAARTAAFESAK